MAEKRKNINIRRTAQVLKAFSEKPKGWGVTELASHLGLAKSVIFQILNTLVDEGLVKKDEKRYFYGDGLLKLALNHFGSIELIKVSRATLEKFVKEFGATTLLFQLVENRNTLVEKVEGLEPIKFTLSIGMEVPIYKGSSGKVWLAFLPDKERQEIINKYKNRINITKLEEEIEIVRKKGFATSIEEVYPGVSAIATPIFNNYDELIGVLSAGRPSLYYDEFLIPRMLNVAKEISFQMGYQNWKW